MRLNNRIKVKWCLPPVALACLLWLSLVVAGYASLLFYEAAPSPLTNSICSWPAETTLERSSKQFTLVLFVHPKCPCSRATLSELAVLLRRCSNDVTAYVVFLRPSGVPTNWEKTDLWFRAKETPGVTTISDLGGRERKNFEAATSGETLLFDPSGKLVFRGGITAGRGHEGDNQGLDVVESIISGRSRLACRNTPVFGCSLQNNPYPNGNLFQVCRK